MNLIWNTGSGNNTVTVGINQGIYLGSIFVDGTAGQVTCNVSYGQSRKWGTFNAYNRVPINLQGGDPTASWNTATSTWRESRGQTTNFLAVFSGLAEEEVPLVFSQNCGQTATNATSIMNIGIGQNSTTSPTGMIGTSSVSDGAQSYANIFLLKASMSSPPFLGINNFNALEQAPSNSTANTFFGTSSNMLLTASYRG